jgi:hypothetical protein
MDIPTSTSTPDERDIVVEYVAWALGWVQNALNTPLRNWQSNLFQRDGRPWLYFNYIYAVEWGIILAGVSLATCIVSGVWLVLLVGVALWRAAEITTWYTKLLLDKTHSNVLSGERNLLFLVFDAAMFVTVLALLLVAGGGSLPGAWSDAVSAFTLNGEPSGYSSSWATASGVVGAVGGVLLLGAGLAVVIGIIQQRIKLSPGRYTGPTRIRRPRRGG